MNSTKRTFRAFLPLVLAGLAPLALLLLLTIDPAFFAAANGWYGYNNQPVSPEPTSAAAASGHLGLGERNNPIHAGSGEVVQFLNGVLRYQADGISILAPGFGYAHRPSYNNNHQWGTVSSSDGNMDLANGWNWHTGLYYLIDQGGGEIRMVGRGTASSKYVLSSGTYYGQFGVDSKIIHNTGADEMLLYGTNGTKVTFYDFDSAHGGKMGTVKTIVDAYGNSLTASYHASGSFDDLLNTLTDSGGHVWKFTYVSTAGDNFRRIEKVEAKRIEGQSETVLAKVEYLYYNSSSGAFASGSGTNGDLMKSVVTEMDSNGLNLQRTTMFRYWTGSWSTSNRGCAHKIKYIVGPQSYAELAAAVADPLKATDTQVAAYADYYVEYDSTNFVTKVTLRGSGCSCSSGGQGTYTFAYSTHTPSGLNDWATSVTQTNPDSTVRIIDVNKAGSIINDIFQTDSTYGTGDQRWIMRNTFDSSGRVTEVYHPSACPASTSYNGTTHVVDPDNSNGFVEVFTYDSYGNLTANKIKKGENATPYWITKNEYTTRTVGSHTVSVPTSSTVYPTETTSDAGGVVTGFDFEFYTGSLAVQELILTYPDVATSQNGSGVGDSRRSYFNSHGQIEWLKDEKDSISHWEYHAELGLATTRIVDVNTGSYSPPSGYTSSSGQSIQTTFTYEANGRPAGAQHPGGRKERSHYTRLSTGEPVVLRYQHVYSEDPPGTDPWVAGPVAIAVFSRDGRLVTTAKGVVAAAVDDDDLDNDFEETESSLETAFQGDLYSRMEYHYEHGQMIESRAWTDAENFAEEKYVTKYSYDSMGRLARVKDAEGTITRLYYTLDARVRSRAMGTNDYIMGDALAESSGSNNMTKVEDFFYDGDETTASAVGDGNVTKARRFVSGTASRDRSFAYDWRNRLASVDGEEDSYAQQDYDNLNRPTVSYRYDTASQTSALRAKSERKYDALGRVYQTIGYEVDQADGSVGASLTTNFWYDARGALVKTRGPSGVFTKNEYDGAGRLLASFVSYDTDEGNTNYSAAHDVTDDTVVSQTNYALDNDGEVQLQTRWERKVSDTGTGEHTSTSTAERYYLASWYDVLGRLTATANYGTNGGTALTRPSTPPASSDAVLVTSQTYNIAGLAGDTTDPAEHVTRREYDNLGRVLSATWQPGDEDRKQEVVYNKVSNVISRKTWLGASEYGLQETAYDYGVVKGTRPDSEIASNNLLRRVRYADPDDGTASGVSATDFHETFAYNAQGEIVYRKDQNGTIHEYDFDELGRKIADKVTLPQGSTVNGAIMRVETTHDALGRSTKITSFDAATGGDIKNEVQITFNGFGQVIASKQSHTGGVGSGTPEIRYEFSEADDGDPISRLASIQYPVTNRKVYLHYDDRNGGTDQEQMDWILGRVTAISNSSSGTAARLADYTYQGLSRVTSRINQETTNDISITYLYDQFGRLEYLTASNPSTISEFRYGYSRDSRVLWREENESGGKDELYGYDGLGRLNLFKRGDLNGTRTDITSPVRRLEWEMDNVGNFVSIAENGGASVGRTHNRANEVLDVDTGYSGQDPTYDKAGNATEIYRPAPDQTGFTYDAWNRLVSAGGSTYEYDGLGRRIRNASTSTGYYYSEGWRVLADRNETSDKTLREYVWGYQYVDEILTRNRDMNSDGDTLDYTDEALQYLQDGNWNVYSVCDWSGNEVERYLYDPYGLASVFDRGWNSTSGATYSNQILFTGRMWNPSSYTYDFRAREYSPYLQRFLQRDPIGIWGDSSASGNGYAYASWDPETLVDPSGLSPRREEELGQGSCSLAASAVSVFPFLSEEFMRDPGGAIGRALRKLPKDPLGALMSLLQAYGICSCAYSCDCEGVNAPTCIGESNEWTFSNWLRIGPPYICPGAEDEANQSRVFFTRYPTEESCKQQCEDLIPDGPPCCATYVYTHQTSDYDSQLQFGLELVAGEILTAGLAKGLATGIGPAVSGGLKFVRGLGRGLKCLVRGGSGRAARGGINVSQRGLTHVLERHAAGGARTAGKSIFNQGEDIAGLIRGAESVGPVQQVGGNFQRIVDAGRAIGIDRATGQPTSVYTVITNAAGDLVTAFPGIP